MGKLPLVSEIMEQSLGRTVEILNAIQLGLAAEKNDQELNNIKTTAPTEDQEEGFFVKIVKPSS